MEILHHLLVHARLSAYSAQAARHKTQAIRLVRDHPFLGPLVFFFFFIYLLASPAFVPPI
ncbi:hypothetical protein DM02DRAFT_398683 [Periconia macrospinosa]|uniref:Uncharacterized protein n=1 Tax=Periconia macrospinosa TaxID=97972 RepID=A0A2V1DQ06_9PLEO|nr:hypothetical protein DM02DRAFT_398683 [Periconia macrospinosa]